MVTSARLLATTRPLSDPGRWLRVAPLAGFAAFAALAVGAGWLDLPARRGEVVLSVLLAAAVAAILASLGLPWHRWSDDRQTALPLGYFVVVMLLDYSGGLYYLAAVPIIWLGLFHSRRLMLLGVGLFAAILFVPRLLRPDIYPVDLPMAELVMVFALIAVAGLAMQGLVEHTRAVAAESASAARQARADRDLLNAYLDNAGCIVAVQDREGRLLVLNRFAERVLGFRTGDLSGQVAWGFMDRIAQARPAFERVLAGDSPVEYESDVMTRWRTARQVAWSATGLVNEAGEVTHVISVGIDITEQRAAERQARTDRDLLNAYLDHAPCLVLVLEPDSRVLLYNRFAEQVLGFRAQDVIGQKAYYHPDEDPEARHTFEQVIAGSWPQMRESDTLTNSGDARRIVWNTTALTDPAGQVTRVISTGMDVTEQRNAERLFANVLAAAAEQMIFAADTDGRFLVFNHGGERLLGYRAEELVGKANVQIMHLPEELAELAAEAGMSSFEELLSIASPEMPTIGREWTMVRKDGSQVPVSMTIDAMLDRGKVVGYVGVARDITAERAAADAMAAALAREQEAAERLRQLDQVKNDFVATVSHDLRTPLTSIIGNTEILLDGDAGPLAGPQHRLLDAIDRNGRRLDTLVGDLLLLSRIESGTLRINLRPAAMGEIVDGALEALAAKLKSGPDLVLDTPDEPVLVMGDPSQLERVATNLLSNALKFTPPGGQVTVALTADADQVELQVADTGIGIPAEELAHVFDRFYRSSRSQQKDRPGTGLGLTIAKSIIEHHGGTIRASANPPGGTTFVVTLPRLAADAADAEAVAAAKAAVAAAPDATPDQR